MADLLVLSCSVIEMFRFTMKETSFGTMEVLLHEDSQPKIESLVFLRAGRAHRHSSYESFVTTAGTGVVYCGDRVIPVQAGVIVTIPPNTLHWMEPSEGEVLKGFLWYHETEISAIKG